MPNTNFFEFFLTAIKISSASSANRSGEFTRGNCSTLTLILRDRCLLVASALFIQHGSKATRRIKEIQKRPYFSTFSVRARSRMHFVVVRSVIPLFRFLIVFRLISTGQGLVPGLYCGKESCYDGKNFHFFGNKFIAKLFFF